MINSGVAIKYGDVAPEAKENFVPNVSDRTYFVDLSQLQKYNLDFPNFVNPCELYSLVLDGNGLPFPETPENENMGLWSEQLSKQDGTFANPIVLTLESEGKYSSQGFTFTFDTLNKIYSSHINIIWYRDDEQLAEDDFYPNDSIYFCRKFVESYNRIVITFYSLNMPQNRLKVRAIDYGYGTFFYGRELRNVRIIQEIDPISSEISINTSDFTLDSKTDIIYSFQAKQPLSVYFNGKLISTSFVRSSKRQSKSVWQIQGEDYIGLMDSIPYYGGIYTNANAVDILSDIFTVAKVPYYIDNFFNNDVITGYIPYTTCREALMHVAFAIQAVVDTSNSDVIKVFPLENDIKQKIPLNRIMQGQNFIDEETVTGVEVSAHTYKPIMETIDVYDSNESGIGKNIFVKFSEPLHDLSIKNGTIVLHGTNYAVIDANEECVLTGQKYEHTTKTNRKNNPLVLASEIEKIVAIDNATLVSSHNVDNILEKCYNWLIRAKRTNLKIVEGKQTRSDGSILYGERLYGEFKYGEKSKNEIIYDQAVNVGESIEAETEYLGIVGGIIIKQTFGLNGGIIIKDAVLK